MRRVGCGKRTCRRRRLRISASQEEEDPGYVSDPPANQKEAHISLTPAHQRLSGAHVTASGEGNHQYSLKAHSPSPTKEEITTYIKCTGARWARVEEWVAGEPQDVPEREDRVWVFVGLDGRDLRGCGKSDLMLQ
ncbi:hypothetical protein FIBSPDRAFT_204253 [Athelia psychrophila]|uniref:Uncharacterized protein n=1 Tax=Athelia psychrophila TaxID=1759441 RepID=A0A166WFQ6_9AGAM|nr:hypothetical protein FIBSPDRAFT_204253 [Fibularhizoctonia sp. CBS 109695]